MGAKLEVTEEKQIIEGVEVSLPKLNLLPLQPYEALRNQLTEITAVSGPLHMRDLNRATEAVAQLEAKVIELRDRALLDRDHARAKAVLEKSTEYFKEKGIKDTAAMREWYPDIDPEVRFASERVNALNALLKILEAKHDAFGKAHDDAKKVYDRITAGSPNRGNREGGYSD
jgi:hypothetical protein